jgi:hypothetical protein
MAGTLVCSALIVLAFALGLPQAAHIYGAQVYGVQAKTNAADAGNLAGDRDVPSATAVAARTRSSNTQSAEATAQAAQDLGKHLEAAKIHALRVSALDGRLVVSGKLTKSQALEWTAIQQWFDQTYGSRIVLTANVTGDDGRTMPALQLQAIWYGDHPYIITAEGERYYQGAVLDNGWIIREITADRLLLARDGDTVALTY